MAPKIFQGPPKNELKTLKSKRSPTYKPMRDKE